jgi:hypothetical protein
MIAPSHPTPFAFPLDLGAHWVRIVRFLRASSMLAVFFVALTGCTATSKYMTPVPSPAPPLAPTPGMAEVVFLRPSGLGSAILFTIVDQNGRFVGDSTAGAHFVTLLPPGEYLFIAEGENTAVMHANLAPGRLYYVEVVPKMGVFSARVGLEPIKPNGPAWAKVSEMLHDTSRFVPLPREGQAALDATASVIQSRVANAKKKWADYSPAERAESSLQPDDGVGGAAIAAVPSPPAGPPGNGPAPTPASAPGAPPAATPARTNAPAGAPPPAFAPPGSLPKPPVPGA